MRLPHIFTAFAIAAALSNASCSTTTTTDAAALNMEPRNPAWAQPVVAQGLPNFFKVSDELYRSAQPVENGMTSAKQAGIQTILSIRETKLDPGLNEAENTQLNLIHIPIVTWNLKDEAIIEVLRTLRDAPKPVLVHCRHGADRTGLVVALYRIIYQDWSKEDAKNELLNGGFGYHAIFGNIPNYLDKVDIDAIKSALN